MTQDPLKSPDLWAELLDDKTVIDSTCASHHLFGAWLALTQPILFEEAMRTFQTMIEGSRCVRDVECDEDAIRATVREVQRRAVFDDGMSAVAEDVPESSTSADLMSAIEKHVGPMTHAEKMRALQWMKLCEGQPFDDCPRGPGGLRAEQVDMALNGDCSVETVPARSPGCSTKSSPMRLDGYGEGWRPDQLEVEICRFTAEQAKLGRRGKIYLMASTTGLRLLLDADGVRHGAVHAGKHPALIGLIARDQVDTCERMPENVVWRLEIRSQAF